MAGRDVAMLVRTWQVSARQGSTRQRSAVHGDARLGEAWRGHGVVRRCAAGPGLAWQEGGWTVFAGVRLPGTRSRLGAAGPGWACPDRAWLSRAGQGLAPHDGAPQGLAGRGPVGRSGAMHGTAWRGSTWLGESRLGLAGQVKDGWTVSGGVRLPTTHARGTAWRVYAWQVGAMRAKARHGAPWQVAARPGMASPGSPWHGAAWHVEARLCTAGRATGSLRGSRPRRPRTRLGSASPGKAWQGAAEHGPAWTGGARLRLATLRAARRGRARTGLWPGPALRGQSRLPGAGQRLARLGPAGHSREGDRQAPGFEPRAPAHVARRGLPWPGGAGLGWARRG